MAEAMPMIPQKAIQPMVNESGEFLITPTVNKTAIAIESTTARTMAVRGL
jgi:hypothetical protein